MFKYHVCFISAINKQINNCSFTNTPNHCFIKVMADLPQ